MFLNVAAAAFRRQGFSKKSRRVFSPPRGLFRAGVFLFPNPKEVAMLQLNRDPPGHETQRADRGEIPIGSSRR